MGDARSGARNFGGWGRVAALLLALMAAAPASAVDPGSPTVTFGGRNVYVAGGSVRPDGPVQGDFTAFGGRVAVDQPVGGDALLFGGAVDVRAPVGDDLRVAGGDVSLEAPVSGELYAAGGHVLLMPGARVGGDASLAGGRVRIEGRVGGALRASAQHVTIDGEIDGDVRLMAQRVELGPRARIGGSLRYTAAEFTRAEGAVVTGELLRDERRPERRARPAPPPPPPDPGWRGLGWAGAIGLLALMAAGALLVLVFPRFADEAPRQIGGAPGLSLAAGLGAVVGVPLLAALLFITLLGIPVGLLVLLLYPPLLLLGYLAGALFVAQRAQAALRPAAASPAARIGFLVLALVVLMLIGWLPVAGPLVLGLVAVAGLGACVLEWQRQRRGAALQT